MYKIFDSHHPKIIISSGATSLLERRAKWEVNEFIKGILERSDSYSSKLFCKCISLGPSEIVKLNKIRKHGGIHFEN